MRRVLEVHHARCPGEWNTHPPLTTTDAALMLGKPSGSRGAGGTGEVEALVVAGGEEEAGHQTHLHLTNVHTHRSTRI